MSSFSNHRPHSRIHAKVDDDTGIAYILYRLLELLGSKATTNERRDDEKNHKAFLNSLLLVLTAFYSA